MQYSCPSDIIAAYKENSTNHSENISLQSSQYQKSTKTTESTISGEKLPNQKIISGAVSIYSKITDRPSNKSQKSDSYKGSKSTEDFSQSYSPLNWDTPSFTENLNTYDFVTDQRDNFDGKTGVLQTHGRDAKMVISPTTHDTAFCLDSRSTSKDSNSLEHNSINLDASKKQRDNSKPILRIRAKKPTSSNKQNFNQDLDNLDTIKQDMLARKQKIQDLRDQLLNKFEDENAWVQDLSQVRKRMRPLSKHQQTSYAN